MAVDWLKVEVTGIWGGRESREGDVEGKSSQRGVSWSTGLK